MKSREYRYLGFQNINQIQFQGVRALLKQAQTRCPQDLPHLSHLFHFRLFRVLQSKQQLLVEKILCTLSREYHGEIEYLHILCWVCYSIISLITTIFSLYEYLNRKLKSFRFKVIVTQKAKKEMANAEKAAQKKLNQRTKLGKMS